MTGRQVFSGEVHVHYGQVYVQSDPRSHGPDMGLAFFRQQNGLCGAGDQGALFLVTGLHTGRVGFAVEVHDELPTLDDDWEDVVEASFTPASPEVMLVQWAGENGWSLDMDPVDYRVRYCAKGMDAGRAADTGHLIDHYLLQFWPDQARADEVIKQTSEAAAYWHRSAQERPTDVEPRRWSPQSPRDDVPQRPRPRG